MLKVVNFDVLVVYTESLAVSASGINSEVFTPFKTDSKNESYNRVYGYFLEKCKEFGIKVALSTSADVIGAGMCEGYWEYKNKNWIKQSGKCFSKLIFDKFSPTRKSIRDSRKLLFSDSKIKPFNNPELFEIFFDKLKTYEELAEYSIPTAFVESRDMASVEKACKKIMEIKDVHPNSNDFEVDMVMKDRFGAGGRHVYKLKFGEQERMLGIVKRHPRVSFIVQPFAKFDKGFSYFEGTASTDIRMIFLGGGLVQSYIRVAKPTDFRCNEHQGGKLTYVSVKNIPLKVVTKALEVAKLLDKTGSLYALDFIVSNDGNVYLLEGNTGPGLDWNESLKKNSWEAKKLIRVVVKELVKRVHTLNIDDNLEVYEFKPLGPVPNLIFPLVA